MIYGHRKYSRKIGIYPALFQLYTKKYALNVSMILFFFGRSLNIVQKVEAPKQQFFIRKWSHTNHQGGCRQCLVRGYKTALVLNIGFFVTAFVYLFTKEEPICAKKAFGPIEAEASENYNRAALFCWKALDSQLRCIYITKAPFKKKNEIPIWQIADKRSRRRGIKPFQMYLRTVCVKKMLQFSLCVDISRKAFLLWLCSIACIRIFCAKWIFFFCCCARSKWGKTR